MNRALALALLLCALAAAPRAAAKAAELTEKTFDEEVRRGTWLIMFYGPSCGHCHALKPNWDKMIAQVEQEGKALNIGRVNCKENMSVCTRYNAFPWPNIKLYTKGPTEHHFTMDAPREQHGSDGVANILGFVARHAPAAVGGAKKAEL